MGGVMRRQLEWFSCLWEAGDMLEIRRFPSGRSDWCRAADLPSQGDRLSRQNKQGDNIYIGANPRKAVGRGVKAENCTPSRPCGKCNGCVKCALSLFADFDNTDVDDAVGRWKDAGLPEPTLVLNSGHGCHIYIRLTEPIDGEMFRQWQTDLAVLLGSDGVVADPARIMRVPGTLNVKDPDNPVPCYIVTHRPEAVASLEELREVVPHVERSSSADLGGGQDCEIQVTPEHLIRIARYASTWPAVPQGTDNGNPGRHKTAFRHAAMLTREFGLAVDQAWPFIQAWNEKNEAPLEEADLRRCVESGRKYGKNAIGTRPTLADDDAIGSYYQHPDEGRTDKTPTGRPETGVLSLSVLSVPWKSPPIEVLPDSIRKFIAEVSNAVGCDPSMVALPALAVLASAIGASHRIELKRSWKEYPILWTAVVAGSGQLKSPAAEKATAQLYQHQQDAFRAYEKEKREYDRLKNDYDAEFAHWKSKGRKAGVPQPEPPELPICRRFICSDVTVESLAPILQVAPRGVLLCRDELAAWLGSFNAYKRNSGGDVAQWLEMHRAGPLIIDRKSTDHKTIYVPRAAVSITGTIQPETLRRALGQEYFENGLAARLLLVMPPRRRKQWTEADLGDKIRWGYESIVNGLLGLEGAEDDNGDPRPIDIPLSPAGKAAWISFYEEHAQRQAEAQGNLAAAFSKIEGYAARFALIVHLVRLVEGDKSLEDPGAVDEQSINAGATLARWFSEEAARIYAYFAEAEEDRGTRRLIQKIRALGGTVTVRDIIRSTSFFKTTEEASRALKALEHAGRGTWREIPSGAAGGRPKQVFQLTDNTDSDKTPSHGGAKGGFVNGGRKKSRSSRDET
jgi:hypothetical protein